MYTTYTKNNIYVCYTAFVERTYILHIFPFSYSSTCNIYREREEDGLLQAFYIYIHIHIHILIPSMASIVNAGARTVSKKSTHANKRLILLFKQTDLRIHDNLVLKKALSLSQPILPLFCFDPRFLGKTKRGEERMSLKRFNFLLESVV